MRTTALIALLTLSACEATEEPGAGTGDAAATRDAVPGDASTSDGGRDDADAAPVADASPATDAERPVADGAPPRPDAAAAADGATPSDGAPPDADASRPDATPDPDPDAGAPDAAVLPPPARFDVLTDDAEVRTDRGRFTAALYFPDTDTPRPLVLFARGFQTPIDQHRGFAERLAAAGFVVVVPDYPQSFFAFDHRSSLDDLVRTLDAMFGFNNDPEHPLHGRIDAAQVGAAGYSLGGKLALWLGVQDARVDAVFGVDPVDGGGGPGGGDPMLQPRIIPDVIGALARPAVFLGERNNEQGRGLDGRACVPDNLFCIPCAPAGANFAAFWDATENPAWRVELADADHVDFLDVQSPILDGACLAAPGDPVAIRGIATDALEAFFLEQLGGAPAGTLDRVLAAAVRAGGVAVERRPGP